MGAVPALGADIMAIITRSKAKKMVKAGEASIFNILNVGSKEDPVLFIVIDKGDGNFDHVPAIFSDVQAYQRGEQVVAL